MDTDITLIADIGGLLEGVFHVDLQAHIQPLPQRDAGKAVGASVAHNGHLMEQLDGLLLGVGVPGDPFGLAGSEIEPDSHSNLPATIGSLTDISFFVCSDF